MSIMRQQASVTSLKAKWSQAVDESLQSAKRTWALVRSNSVSLLLPPLLLLGLLVGLGTWAVCYIAKQNEDQARSLALDLAHSAASAIELAITRTYQPALTLASLLSINRWPTAKRWLPGVIANLHSQAPQDYIQEFLVLPNAVLQYMYPPQEVDTVGLGVTDILNMDKYRNRTLANIRYHQPAWVWFTDDRDPNGPRKARIGVPIFADNVSADEDFGMPPGAKNCPRNICYNEATHTKFWGAVSVGVNWMHLASLQESNLQLLIRQGYDLLILWDMDNDGIQEEVLAQTPHTPDASNAVKVPIHLPASQWDLYVAPQKGFSSSWLAPAIVGVVLFSLLASIQMFWALLSRHEHRMLLSSLVPQSVIQRTKTEATYLTTGSVTGCPPAISEPGTPAEAIMNMVADFLEGRVPPMSSVLMVRAAILHTYDIYQPVNLGEKMAAELDGDVAMALMRQLGQQPDPSPSLPLVFLNDSSDPPDKANAGPEAGNGDEYPEYAGRPYRLTGNSGTFMLMLPASVGGGDEIRPLGDASRSRSGGYPSLEDALKEVLASEAPVALHLPHEHTPTQRSSCVFDLGSAVLRGNSVGQHALTSSGAGHLGALLQGGGGVAAAGGRLAAGGDCAVRLQEPTPAAGPAVALLPLPPSPSTGCSMLSENGALAHRLSSRLHMSTPCNIVDDNNHRGGVVQEADDADASLQGQDCVLATHSMPINVVPAPIIEEVDHILAQASASWEFDAFQLDAATGGHGLSALGYFLMHESGLIRRFKLPPRTLATYLRTIEAGYLDNPYHNRVHASDVLQTIHVVLTRGGLTPGYADPLTLLACYLSAVVHDYEHRGVTNDFLIGSSDMLATRYNDRSPMENHHLAAAFELLKTPAHNFLAPLAPTQMTSVRKMVIELVLGTDMKQHFSTISMFTSLHRPAPPQPPETTGRGRLSVGRRSVAGQATLEPAMSRRSLILNPGQAQHNGGASETSDLHPHRSVCVPVDEADRMLSLQVALKCADLGHIAEGRAVHLAWVGCLEMEFFRQGDAEKSLGLPVSPLFDRDKPGVTKSQVGFFNFVAIPLFQNFAGVFPGAEPMLRGVMDNHRFWQDREKEGKLAEALSG